MGSIINLIRQLDDERKTGRTLSVFVVLVVVLRALDARVEAIDLGANVEIIAGVLTPAVEYFWRKLRTMIGLDRTGGDVLAQ